MKNKSKAKASQAKKAAKKPQPKKAPKSAKKLPKAAAKKAKKLQESKKVTKTANLLKLANAPKRPAVKKKALISKAITAPAQYDHLKIEKKWQKAWAASKVYKTPDAVPAKAGKSAKPKAYILDMFPYPSGVGLHVGHPKGYIATDVYSRFKKMSGFEVLHPMGWDAFGLPAEEYAIKNKVHPSIAVKKNVKRYKEQLSILGFNYDWSREVDTTDPEYYKWTQWAFLQMHKKGLTFESHEPINWCPSCKTGLANEDLEDGKCERCGSLVEKKPIRQWMIRITDYADRLLADLDAVEYKMPVVIDHVNPPKPGAPEVERRMAHAIVFDPRKNKYLIIRNKKHGWDTIVMGGMEHGETDPIETAKREVAEETGYVDIEFKKILGGETKAMYHAKHKGENRIAYATGVYFELKSEKRVPIAEGEDKDNEILWVSPEDFVPGKLVNSELPTWLERLKDPSKGLPKQLVNWPESIKESQRNWIGRSEGAELDFVLKSNGKIESDEKITVFTTRADTLFGVTYIVLAPELPLVQKLSGSISNWNDVESYIKEAKQKSVIERTAEGKEKTGVQLEGVFAFNPINDEQIPVWVADYVLADYGTGAVMAVPAHDERDYAFAKKYELPITRVIEAEGNDAEKASDSSGFSDKAYTGSGTLINSDKWNGKNSADSLKGIVEAAKGRMVVNYKLRDWVFSRQRYWGEPIPLIHCPKCGVVPVPEKELPLKLPFVKSYEPTGTGESPLAAMTKWVNVKCPVCKTAAKRETNTMPQWAGSCWYYLRYIDPKNKKQLVDPKKEAYWNPVDMYVGGAEHATRHLIYARFWHKFLYDIGAVNTIEPFRQLKSVGLIAGPDGRKMSKRFGNVVNPDDVVKTYGADTLRVYEMFMGPFDQGIAWSTDNMIGSRRFIEKVWRLREKVSADAKFEDSKEVFSLLHKTIKKVGEDIDTFSFNTAISAMMILVNAMEKEGALSASAYATLLKLIAPFAPHMADELYASLPVSIRKAATKEKGGEKSIALAEWPTYDPALLVDASAIVVVQINGKVRATLNVSADDAKDESIMTKIALDLPQIKEKMAGLTLRKTIFVPGKIVNFVAN